MTSDDLGPVLTQKKPVTGDVESQGGVWRRCPECNRPFVGRRSSQEACSARCYDRLYNRRRPVQRVPVQGGLFGEERKELGKALAAERNQDQLELFRCVARGLVRELGEVCIDDIRASLDRQGISYDVGNWMGSVFNEPGWVFVRFKRATHVEAHARPVGVWRLR